jgi:hypothetical protein
MGKNDLHAKMVAAGADVEQPLKINAEALLSLTIGTAFLSIVPTQSASTSLNTQPVSVWSKPDQLS